MQVKQGLFKNLLSGDEQRHKLVPCLCLSVPPSYWYFSVRTSDYPMWLYEKPLLCVGL